MFLPRNFLLFFAFYSAFSTKTIWFIRHCDKPKSSTNRCCSDLGYERAQHWPLYFTSQTNSNHFDIYASDFDQTKACAPLPNLLLLATRRCQKSQRMYLTALELTPSPHKINLHYCVGQWQPLVKEIKQSPSQQIIVVWEHKEIVHMIREFGILLPKWPNKFREEYSLVFRIDQQTGEFRFGCFDYKTNRTKCREDIERWLQPVYQTSLSASLPPTNLRNHSIETAFLFSILGFLGSLSFLGSFYLLIVCTARSRRRQGYTEISL